MINVLAALFIFVAFAVNPIFGVILFVVVIGMAVVQKNKSSGGEGTKSLIKGIWIALLEMIVVLVIAIRKGIKK